jgi:hypothetical protein
MSGKQFHSQQPLKKKPRFNLTKEIKNLYNENYKSLKNEIGEVLPCSWIGRINFGKMAILLKAIYRFNAMPTKVLMLVLAESGISTLKFIWKRKRPPNSKSTPRKMRNSGGITIPDFKVYYRAILTK